MGKNTINNPRCERSLYVTFTAYLDVANTIVVNITKTLFLMSFLDKINILKIPNTPYIVEVTLTNDFISRLVHCCIAEAKTRPPLGVLKGYHPKKDVG